MATTIRGSDAPDYSLRAVEEATDLNVSAHIGGYDAGEWWEFESD